MVKYSSAESLDFVFMALANPTRRGILSALKGGEQSAQDLAAPFDMSLPAVSKHLRVLENAKLIKRQIRGRQHLFTVRPKKLKEASHWVNNFEEFWTQNLENLEIFLNKEKV